MPEGSKQWPAINAYVTSRGGVVVLNGPFPLPEAERIKSLCDAAPSMLALLEAAWEIVEDEAERRAYAHRAPDDTNPYWTEMRELADKIAAEIAAARG